MAAVQDLVERYAPLTEAEAQVVLARVETTGKSEEDVVAEVKAERVGPARSWDAQVADQQRRAEQNEFARVAEAEAATGIPVAERDLPPEVEDEDEAEPLDGGESVLLDTTDEEFNAWLFATSVPGIVEELEALGEDERPTAAIRIREHEAARGDAARSTLLEKVEPYAEEAYS